MQLLRHVFARLALPALVGFMAFRPALGQPATVILVRHAERAQTPAGDPVLTDAGLARAADLAATLANASVTSVITTHLQRTQLTARHVMQANGQTHIVVRAGGPIQTHVDSVAAAIRRRPAGDVVLVVGHSNTIPPIIAALGGPAMPDLCENQYSSLFILELPASTSDGKPAASPRLIKAKYGAPDPAGSENCERMR
jgi:broad specificity phosphatase PhoE